MGLWEIDPCFEGRLQAAYARAMFEGLWKGKYAARNHHEYWAEGVQSWFGTNRPPDHDHNHVDTRRELIEYDPRLARLLASVFGENDWRYTPPGERAGQAHLSGFRVEQAPSFAWPKDLEAWYRKRYSRKGQPRPEGEETEKPKGPGNGGNGKR